MLNRERRFWTAHEDQLLREAVEIGEFTSYSGVHVDSLHSRRGSL